MIVVFSVTLPPVPVIVIVLTPVLAVEATLICTAAVPEPGAGIGLGLKATVTPVGWPVAVRVIAESNPPETAVVTCDLPVAP